MKLIAVRFLLWATLAWAVRGEVEGDNFLLNILEGSLGSTPTVEPTAEPTAIPTTVPTMAATMNLTASPSASPTPMPTFNLTAVPSAPPTAMPTYNITASPSMQPTTSPTTVNATAVPSAPPTMAVTANLTASPSANPTPDLTPNPSRTPTRNPTRNPTRTPTRMPTTADPTALPTPLPGDPTLAPTEAPTEVPTAVPTGIPTLAPSYQTSPILTFSSNLTMGGIPTPELDTNSQLALIDVTASSMGITKDTVFYVRGYPTAENRRLTLRAGISLFTTSYSIKAETQVNIPLSATGSSNATALYLQLTQSLDAAVADGSFTTNLKAASVLYNATDLANADVTGVSNSQPSVNNDLQYPPESDDALSAGAITGIVLGAIVGFLLIVALFYYFCYIRETADTEKQYFESRRDVEISL